MKHCLRSIVLSAIALSLLVSVSLCIAAQPGKPDADDHSPKAEFRSDRILVMPKKGVDLPRMAQIHASSRSRVRQTFSRFDNLQVIDLPEGADPLDYIARYKKSGLVEYAEPDYYMYVDITEPNDPYYHDMSAWGTWGLRNIGQKEYPNSPPGKIGADIDAPNGWDIIHNAPDVKVAVIDTGVFWPHPDLNANMWRNPGEWGAYGELAYNGIDDDRNGYVDDVHGINALLPPGHPQGGDPMDTYGHGTHVAGTIGAVGNNGGGEQFGGVVGVAWQVQIMALKTGNEGNLSTSAIIASIDYAIANGADVINASFSGLGFDQSFYMACARARDADITIVTCPGNSWYDIDSWNLYPACFDLDNIVVAAATDRYDNLGDFGSCWGTGFGRRDVDLGAPGKAISSTWINAGYSPLYNIDSGTSMAAPHISGVFALLEQQYNEEYPLLITRVFEGAEPIDSLKYRCSTGSRLDLYGALTCVDTTLYPSPARGLHFGCIVGQQAHPSGTTFKLTNFGTTSVGWTAAKTQDWLDISPASGTVGPKASVNVTVSANSGAQSLSAGLHTDTVTFTNVTDSEISTRTVSLDVYGGPLHVKPDGDDNNDGTSWMLAKKSVQAAVFEAVPGQDVWVAAGTYTEPIIMADGVLLFGGFAGNETAREQRDIEANVTTLKPGMKPFIVNMSNLSDPRTTVDGFRMEGPVPCIGEGVDCRKGAGTISNNTILNTVFGIVCNDSSPLIAGNKIMGGNSYRIYCWSGSPVIQNNLISGSAYGCGIFCFRLSNPTITGNTITGNSASGSGAGIFLGGPGVVSGNTITGNNATVSGGGIYCDGTGDQVITGNIITGNQAANSGAGICLAGPGGPKVSGNVISGNTSSGSGGGVYATNGAGTIVNNTIVSNSAVSGGGVYFGSTSTATAGNNIVAFCSSGICKDAAASPILSHNNVYGNTSYSHSWSPDPTGTDGNISADPKLASLLYGDLHIQPGSPCRDTGTNNLVDAGSEDIDGEPRIQPVNGTVDIGADEADGTFRQHVVYVSPSGDDVNDGSSWALAKQTVQAAIDAQPSIDGREVWVAAGTYVEEITVGDRVAVLGGFAGTETLSNQRDWKTNLTVLNGSGLGSVVTVEPGATRQSYIDGFTITGGASLRGGGIYSDCASPTIQNNRIVGNDTAWPTSVNGFGGGIYLAASQALVRNNFIEENRSFHGGGIYSDAMSSPTISGNVIIGNTAVYDGFEAGYGGWGGGINSAGGSPVIVNNTIVGNQRNDTLGGVGGGIFIGGGTPTIANNIICSNDDGVSAAAGVTPSLHHNDVYGNTAWNYSTGLAPGTGSISADPMLASLSQGDMHIGTDSPCRDAGDSTVLGIGEVDIDGQKRVNGQLDIGADEYTVIRVSRSGNDGGDGSSWANAKLTVQDAIDSAIAPADIWVAAGDYQQNLTMVDSLALYGGFAGTETFRDERDWRANITILRGEGGGSGPVVTIDEAQGGNRIDGFTITGGEAIQSAGSGVYCTDSHLTVANNVITGNASLGESASAGGLYLQGSNVEVLNNLITGNIANGGWGGGLYVTQSSGHITRNIITENQAFFGAGIYFAGPHEFEISGNVIADNQAYVSMYGGGGILCSDGSPLIVNNTIAWNTGDGKGGGISCTGSAAPTIVNNIIAFNDSGVYTQSANTSADFNDVYGNSAYNYQGVTPGTNDISLDPMLASAAGGNWHILPGSPCMNAGDSSSVPSGLLLDIDGQDRIDSSSGVVDMGVDESYSMTLRVSTNGDDANDGSSWALAKRTVQAAIDSAVGPTEIWVAAGTYNERLTFADGVELYGGFVGIETERSQRNWTQNVTLLDGGDCDGDCAVVWLADCPSRNNRVDGFTIRNTPLGFGGGVYSNSSTLTVAHNTITHNTRGFGGGIYGLSSGLTIMENKIVGNTGDFGGGIYAETCTGEIVRNLIDGNMGGGILLSSSGMRVDSNTITDNGSGGIAVGGSAASIINNTIVRNSAFGIDCTSASTIANNIVGLSNIGIRVPYGYGVPTLVSNDVYGNTANYDGIDPGPTDISANPQFASTFYEDWRIQADSPCKETGSNAHVVAGSLDMEGQPRIQPVEGTVDIGSDESDGTQYHCVIHVRPDGDDLNDGLSWATAKQTIQAAIDQPTPCQVREIWVAAGTYTENVLLSDRTGLFGGFDGSETDTNQRDWRTNTTIIDGGLCNTTVTVVYGASELTLIDGFTIRNGLSTQGAGVHISGSPIIQNNRIVDNDAAITASGYGAGGGIYCGGNSEPLIRNNYIESNRSFSGGGIHVSTTASPSIIGNVIRGNGAAYDGYEEGAGGWGGGIYTAGSSPVIVNNTIVSNTRNDFAGGVGGGIYVAAGDPVIENNIISFNDDGISAASGITPTLSHNDVYGNADWNYSDGLTPGTGSISVDPKLASVIYGNMHIQPNSPCKEAGLASWCNPGELDIDGNGRCIGAIDIGADESDGTYWSSIVYVTPDGDDTDDGLTWFTAKRTVQAGVDAAASGKEVWVKAGTYVENISLRDRVAVFGGFQGNETSMEARDPIANVSIIHGIGGGSGPVVTIENAGDRINRIDGFTITGGDGLQSTGAGIYCQGSTLSIENNTITGNNSLGESANAGGMYIIGSDVTVKNNLIANNISDSQGGGIFLAGSCGDIRGNTIAGNQALFGGGIYCVASGNAMIRDNVIAENNASASMKGGGGIYCTDCSPMIVNNTIVENTTPTLGGGISLESSSAMLRNNIIALGSSGIYADAASHPMCDWNDVYGNTAYNYQGITPGSNDISADPQFVNPAGADYYLRGTSPCIDAALAQGHEGIDRDGNIRPVDGDGDDTADWDIGAYEYIPDFVIIRETKPDGARVDIRGASVTACFLNADPSGEHWVYVEDIDRTGGIRVKTSTAFSIGDLVRVAGTMQTDTINGERYVDADPHNPRPSGGVLGIGSVGMRNKWIGGAASGSIPVLKDGFGFYNTGMLVQSWGAVMHVYPAQGCFYISDGSQLWDGSGTWGTRVQVPAGVQMPDPGQYVKVTGISSATRINPNYVRVLRVRNGADIQIVTDWYQDPVELMDGCWNMLSLPGIPMNPSPESVFRAAVGEPSIVVDGFLKYYDALDQAWIYYQSCTDNFPCLVAEGYALYIEPNGANGYDYWRTQVTGDQLISLPRGSDPEQFFSFMGNPFNYGRQWSSIQVVNGSAVASLPEAVSLGWIHRIDYWTGSNWTPVTDFATGAMAKRTGYCIYPKVNNLALIVPAQ